MPIRPTPRFTPAIALGGLLALSPLPIAGAAEPIESSVLANGEYVVTTAGGLHRAPVKGGAWQPVAIPDTLHLPGRLTASPEGDLFHYTFRSYIPAQAQGNPATVRTLPPGKISGIHRRSTRSTDWTLILTNADVAHVLVDGPRLFALVHHPEISFSPADILESTNRGTTWKVLPRPPHPPFQLFPDPLHPGQVCGWTHGLRLGVVHAPTPAYQWQAERAAAWSRQLPTTNPPTPVTRDLPPGPGNRQRTLENFFTLPAALRE